METKPIVMKVYYDPNTFLGDRIRFELSTNYANLYRGQKVEMFEELYISLEELSRELIAHQS